SVSICLSKGLGIPAGSVLTGGKEFIEKAKRVRKVMGGAMRQAGYLAAAGVYALENNIERLKDDHKKARRIADTLKEQSYVKNILPVDSNILVVELSDDTNTEKTLSWLEENGILAVPFGPNTIRMVTHLDVSDEDVEKVIEVVGEKEMKN
ncbi:MAG: low specificity L-threonine aldolase, partial [Flavobacteriales bacterium]